MKMFIAVMAVLAAWPMLSQEPLPFLHKDDIIVFQGDSITDGNRG